LSSCLVLALDSFGGSYAPREFLLPKLIDSRDCFEFRSSLACWLSQSWLAPQPFDQLTASQERT
jgi:hypothetical protein